MQDWLRKTFRILNWLPEYNTNMLRGDLAAGITAGVIFIPQGMAYAVIAGVPPIYGLYGAVVPLLIYPLLGTSKHLSVGTAALGMLIVSAGVGALNTSSVSEYVTLTLLLTFMTGLIQVLMGSFRLGFVFRFFSRPVISGFTTAAPIIIISSQLGALLGLDLPRTEFFPAHLMDVLQNITVIHWPTFVVGATGIICIGLLGYFKPKFPGSVLFVVLGIAASYYFDFEQYGIALTGTIPEGLPAFQLPQLSISNVQALLPTAITLAMEQFMTISSLAKAFAKRHNYSIDANHELIAIGSSNFFGSFFQSVPVSGSFSRSAASEQAGMKTPLANVFTSLVIMVTLLFLTPIFYYLPEPILAAIIVVSVVRLIEIDEFIFLYKTKRSEGIVAVVTFLATILIGIQEGILFGVATSMVAVLYKISRPNVAELGLIPDTQNFQDIDRNPEAESIQGIMVLRVDASFSFVNAEYFRDFILKKAEDRNSEIHHVILDGSTINDLDITAIDALKSIAQTLHDWDIQLYFANLKGPVRDIVLRSGLKDYMGADHFYRTPHIAVREILKHLDDSDSPRRKKFRDLSDTTQAT
jgi:SulP family sulfate permease